MGMMNNDALLRLESNELNCLCQLTFDVLAKTTKAKMLEILDELAVDHLGKLLEAVGMYPYDASKPPPLPAPANDAAASPANSANS